MILDSSGRILVTGKRYSPEDMVVWRYDEDGILDASFGDQGTVVFDDGATPGSIEWGSGLVLDSCGRLVVSGAAPGGVALWRYE